MNVYIIIAEMYIVVQEEETKQERNCGQQSWFLCLRLYVSGSGTNLALISLVSLYNYYLLNAEQH